MKYVLPELKFSYEALEPFIDQATMNIHHTKHHAAYINNLNAALENQPELLDKNLESLLTSLDQVPQQIYWTVRNNAGGHYNHTLFWSLLGQGSGAPEGVVLDQIVKAFGSLDTFKSEFTKAALTRFGSGWAWLVKDSGGKLSITSTPNQDSPVSEGLYPILGLDVWEHAYYLKYQNRRADYIEAFWNVLNWKVVEDRLVNSPPLSFPRG